MAFVKRIFLFLAVNFLVIITLSCVLSLFNIKPYLTSYGLNYNALMIFCLIWGMGGAFISLALSKMMAKWMVGVKIIDPIKAGAQEKALLNTVHDLCRQAGFTHMPEVGIYPSQEPNAFATGASQKHALIAVSSGLLQGMSHSELEGVLSHEIAHIQNGDMVTMTLLQGVVNAFVMFLARVLAFAFSALGKNKDEDSPIGSYLAYNLLVILFEVVFMILGSLVVAWFSRYREFRADQGGAHIAGRQKMISALQALQRMQGIQDPKTAKSALNSFKISTSRSRGLLSLFASHPPLDLRIQRLKEFS